MGAHHTVFVGFIFSQLVIAWAQITDFEVSFSVEAEYFESQIKYPVHPRSAASMQETVWMHEGEKIHLCFCALNDITIQSVNVVYSNDGDEDIVNFYTDAIEIGTFQTHSMSNRMVPSSNLLQNNVYDIESGPHNITIEVHKADRYGVEFDRVDVVIQNNTRAKVLHNVGCDTSFCP
uniref:GOLD domain-containing protein n=1 Tax=Octopus bimaculoides TaxID=37653 RepID=A0A0L8G9A5_OCTBM